MTQIATLVFMIGIAGLFWLDRDAKARTSKALWLPVFWVLIVGSRPVSAWLGGGAVQTVDFEDGSPVDRNIFLLLLGLAIFVLVQRGPTVGKVLRSNWALLLFIGYCAISVVWSSYPEVAAKRWIKALGDVAMVLIVLTDPERKNALKRFLARVGFILLPWSVLLIKYYPDYGRAYSKWEGTAFYVGVASDKNMLGMISMVFGLGAAWRFVHEWRGESRRGVLLVHGMIFAMSVWLLSTANSMTSMACFMFGVALIVITSSKRLVRTPARIHFMVGGGLLASSSVLFLNVGGSLLTAMGRNATLTGRTDLWPELLKIDHAPILGAGYESFWSPEHTQTLQAILHWVPNEAHNGYLEIYLNLGWVGIILFGVLVVSGYQTVFRFLRYDTEIGRLKLAYFVVALAYSFTEAGFRNLTPIWIAFLFAIINIPLSRPAKRVPQTAEPDPAHIEVPAIVEPATAILTNK